jgi:hypothetical protein
VITKHNPLQALLNRAAALPATGLTEHYQQRLNSSGSGLVILADVSSSMMESAGSRSKIDVLRGALASAPPARIVAFSSTAEEISSLATLPAPYGGTALHLALALASAMSPERTLVISDGRPDSEDAAIPVARRLSGTIDVIYCGPDSDTGARDFLMRLARTGGGRYVEHDLRRSATALAPSIRWLLSGGGG